MTQETVVFMFLMDKQDDDDDENFVTSGWYIFFFSLSEICGKTDVVDNFVKIFYNLIMVFGKLFDDIRSSDVVSNLF